MANTGSHAVVVRLDLSDKNTNKFDDNRAAFGKAAPPPLRGAAKARPPAEPPPVPKSPEPKPPAGPKVQNSGLLEIRRLARQLGVAKNPANDTIFSPASLGLEVAPAPKVADYAKIKFPRRRGAYPRWLAPVMFTMSAALVAALVMAIVLVTRQGQATTGPHAGQSAPAPLVRQTALAPASTPAATEPALPKTVSPDPTAVAEKPEPTTSTETPVETPSPTSTKTPVETPIRATQTPPQTPPKSTSSVSTLLASLNKTPTTTTPTTSDPTSPFTPATTPPPADLPSRLSLSQLQRGLAPARAAARRCYRQHKEKGVAQLRLTIRGTDGRVTAASVSGALRNSRSGRCLVAAAKNLRFARFANAAQHFSYPIFLK